MATDYFLAYLDKNGSKRAAAPDNEGIYKFDIEFPEFVDPISPTEIMILEMENLDHALQDESEETIQCELVGKFVGSSPIHECIDKIGFEKFFTATIKKYISSEYSISPLE